MEMFSKDAAVEMMRLGMKLTHITFINDEWVSIRGNDTILTDDGYTMSEDDFWQFRSSKIFDSGWSLFN